MVLTKSELVSSLKHEVQILLHLAGKLDRSQLDYRPTSKQRTPLELLQYLTIMGPQLIRAAKAGAMDTTAWAEAQKAAAARDFDQTLAAIAAESDEYETLLADVSDASFREEVEFFGNRSTRGQFLVNMVLCGHAAYRTQLFLYLKSCGRDELNTLNLWAGVDAPMAV